MEPGVPTDSSTKPAGRPAGCKRPEPLCLGSGLGAMKSYVWSRIGRGAGSITSMRRRLWRSTSRIRARASSRLRAEGRYDNTVDHFFFRWLCGGEAVAQRSGYRGCRSEGNRGPGTTSTTVEKPAKPPPSARGLGGLVVWRSPAHRSARKPSAAAVFRGQIIIGRRHV